MARAIGGLIVLALTQFPSPVCARQAAPPDSAPVLSTGITGTLTASGAASPTFALSFRPVQRLVLAAAGQPVTRRHADSLLAGTPITLGDLTRLGLLREEAGRYRIDYLVLTRDDQRTIYAVAERLGADLAGAIRRRGADFHRLVSRYPDPDLRETLEFGLVAGMVLNWDGLELTTALGYRAAPIQRPNGDRYLVHSAERGAGLRLTGLYWGSESWPGRTMTLTTLGDAESFPRRAGLPNLYDGPFEAGLASLEDAPDLYAAARAQLLTYLGLAVDDAGVVLERMARGPISRAELAAAVGLAPERLAATLQLLEAINYVCRSGDQYHINVPVLIERDRPIVDSTLRIGRDVMTEWLEVNAPRMARELSGLSPLRNGLPFSLVFSELWHYVFGFATKSLAESGFFLDPRAPGRVALGYVPLVWMTSLHKF